MSRARCPACLPATSGYDAASTLSGGFAWHEAQFATPRGSETWQVVQMGPDFVEVPEGSWQPAQSVAKVPVVARVCAVLSMKGTAWDACPGPLEWHDRDTAPGAPFV